MAASPTAGVKRRLGAQILFALSFAAFLALAALELGVFEIPQVRALAPARFEPVQGALYRYRGDLPSGDNFTLGNCALPLLLYEDGRPLGPPHTGHDVIRAEGRGRYSHWGHSLFFSSSDNTDPRANGRAYSVCFPWQVPVWLWFVVAALALGSFLPVRPWRMLSLLLALALVALVVHSTGLLEARLGRLIHTPAIVHVEGALCRYEEPFPKPDGFGGDPERSRLRVYEDGRPLGPAHVPHKDIAACGGGGFSHFGNNVFFSSRDGSDPRTNGRTYTVTYPWDPPLWVAPALVAALFLALYFAGAWRRAEEADEAQRVQGALERAARRLVRPLPWAIERLDALTPAQAGGLVLLLAAVFRIVIAARLWHGDVGGHMVKGMPFSDGNDWFILSQEMSLGERWNMAWQNWTGLRPFYYVFMSCVMAVAGPTVVVARVTQILLSLAGAGLVFDALRRLVRTPLAFVLALGLCFSYHDARYALPTTTETVGNFFSNFALWVLVWGLERRLAASAPGLEARWRPWREGPFLASGVLLGLSNLARPLTLPVLAPLALALGLLAWRHREVPRRWRAVSAVFLAVVLGVAIALAPWLARQYAVHRVVALSTNSASVFYAATSPDLGTWRPDVEQLGKRLPTIRERVTMYENLTRQNLRQYPLWYLGNVMYHLGLLARDTRAPVWFLILCALFAAGRGLRLAARHHLKTRLAFFVPALVLVFLALAPDQGHYFWIAGLVVAFVTAEPILLVGAMLCGGLTSLGLTALSYDPRFFYPLEWMAWALSGWFIWWLTELVCSPHPFAREVGPRAFEPSADWGAWGRRLRWLGVIALALFLAGAGRVVYRNVFESHSRPELALSAEEAAPWVKALLDDPQYRPYAFLKDVLVVGRAPHRDGEVARFEPGESFKGLKGMFTPRPFPFSIFTTRYGGYALFAGELRDTTDDLILIGFRMDAGSPGVHPWVEVLAYCPDTGTAGPGQLVKVAPEVVPAHIAYIRAFQGTAPPRAIRLGQAPK